MASEDSKDQEELPFVWKSTEHGRSGGPTPSVRDINKNGAGYPDEAFVDGDGKFCFPGKLLDNSRNMICKRTHPAPSGWTISGRVCEDWYYWVEEFEASHPEHGKVKGDFSAEVWATSQAAFEHFKEHHPYSEFDTQDI